MEYVKPKEQVEMERQSEELERQIVKFTNIDNESFTHSFRGISITVAPGESYMCRLPEGDHLATHLSRKILSRNRKKVTDKMVGVVLWTDKDVQDLKSKILSQVGSEQKQQITQEEAHKKDIEELHEKFNDKPADKPITKKDVIEALEKRGEKVDVSKTKKELLQRLIELESMGITE